MKKTKRDWKNVKLKEGDVLIVYKGLGFIRGDDNTIALKGNISESKLASKVVDLVLGEF